MNDLSFGGFFLKLIVLFSQDNYPTIMLFASLSNTHTSRRAEYYARSSANSLFFVSFYLLLAVFVLPGWISVIVKFFFDYLLSLEARDALLRNNSLVHIWE